MESLFIRAAEEGGLSGKDKDDRVGLRVVGREMKRIKCCRILFCGVLVSLMLCTICLMIQKTCLIKYNSP